MSELLGVNDINLLKAQNEDLRIQNQAMYAENRKLEMERNKYADALREIYQACETSGEGLNVFIQDLISEVLDD